MGRVVALLCWHACAAFQGAHPSRGARRLALRAAKEPYGALRCRQTPGVVLIDGDNCRGKSRWQFSAAELSSRVVAAARRSSFGAEGVDTVLFLDHGERRDCFAVEGCGVAFAGRRSTADDAIVDAVEWWLERNVSVVVVTSDYGLRQRATYLAARGARAGRFGASSKAGDVVRFVASEALVDAFEGEDAPLPARSFEAPFERALDRLATHVLTAPASVRARLKRRNGQRRPSQPVGSPLGNEQTWMRVVMAEKLRWLLAQAEPDGCSDRLGAFRSDFSDPTDERDAPSVVLQHPLSDRKHRHELLRFADALRRPPAGDDDDEKTDDDQADAPAVPPVPASTNLAGNRRLRRSTRRKAKRLRDARGTNLKEATKLKGPPTKALLADRDDLERALRAWLRDEEEAVASHAEI